MPDEVFSKLESKYGFGRLAQADAEDRAVQGSRGMPVASVRADVPGEADGLFAFSWKDSPPVRLLSGFIKENRGQGFTLYQTMDGYPLLGRKPRFLENGAYDQQWLTLAEEACFYMAGARDDLTRLIRAGNISFVVLPLYERDVVSNNEEFGRNEMSKMW